ncbi:MAG: 6-phosphogluconolactonase [Pseudomonadota bacterium]
MELRVLPNAPAVANAGADFIADSAKAAIAERGKFVFAVSGGRTPWVMLTALAKQSLPWDAIHIVQVDERVAPANDPDRNLAHLRASLLSKAPLPAANIHAMPVEDADLVSASRAYGQTLEKLAGSPPILDLVHLGLGPDGHTASLVPGDPVLAVSDELVGTTGVYQGHHRMTLTYPVLNQARSLMFVVTGEEKVDALVKLMKHDQTIPAGRIRLDNALVIADQSAAGDSDHG